MKGWVGLAGWPCRGRWSPISSMSSVGQGKFAGLRPTFYHCATQPTHPYLPPFICCTPSCSNPWTEEIPRFAAVASNRRRFDAFVSVVGRALCMITRLVSRLICRRWNCDWNGPCCLSRWVRFKFSETTTWYHCDRSEIKKKAKNQKLWRDLKHNFMLKVHTKQFGSYLESILGLLCLLPFSSYSYLFVIFPVLINDCIHYRYSSSHCSTIVTATNDFAFLTSAQHPKIMRGLHILHRNEN